ncbi:MAG TPA: hypothetical protein VF601_07805 [Beijerinckiaceae bacterium]|jgi:hypothetical protein
MTSTKLAVWGFLGIMIILLGFGFVVLWKVITDRIDLSFLVSEPVVPGVVGAPPKASLSRFQFLVFTFVIAGLYLLLCIEAGTFIDIPTNVLGLLGISGGSFVVSKAIGTPSSSTPAVQDIQEKAAPHPSTITGRNPENP